MAATASITYAGHSTVFITTEGGKKIIIDPFLEGSPVCPEAMKTPDSVDYIVLTHGHSDHASSAADLAAKHGATVFAIWELGLLMAKEGVPEGQIQFMNKGGTVEPGDGSGIKVTLTNAYHSSSYDAKDGTTYYAGEACGAVITLESSRTIYHAGDTSLFSDMQFIGERFCPEVALLPIGDRFTMDPIDAARAVRLLRPKTVIPIHYATFDLLTGTAEEFVSALDGVPVAPVVLEPGGEFSF